MVQNTTCLSDHKLSEAYFEQMMEVSSVASQLLYMFLLLLLLLLVVVVAAAAAAGGGGWLWLDDRTNQASPPDLQCELEDSPPGRSDMPKITMDQGWPR